MKHRSELDTAINPVEYKSAIESILRLDKCQMFLNSKFDQIELLEDPNLFDMIADIYNRFKTIDFNHAKQIIKFYSGDISKKTPTINLIRGISQGVEAISDIDALLFSLLECSFWNKFYKKYDSPYKKTLIVIERILNRCGIKVSPEIDSITAFKDAFPDNGPKLIEKFRVHLKDGPLFAAPQQSKIKISDEDKIKKLKAEIKEFETKSWNNTIADFNDAKASLKQMLSDYKNINPTKIQNYTKKLKEDLSSIFNKIDSLAKKILNNDGLAIEDQLAIIKFLIAPQGEFELTNIINIASNQKFKSEKVFEKAKSLLLTISDDNDKKLLQGFINGYRKANKIEDDITSEVKQTEETKLEEIVAKDTSSQDKEINKNEDAKQNSEQLSIALEEENIDKPVGEISPTVSEEHVQIERSLKVNSAENPAIDKQEIVTINESSDRVEVKASQAVSEESAPKVIDAKNPVSDKKRGANKKQKKVATKESAPKVISAENPVGDKQEGADNEQEIVTTKAGYDREELQDSFSSTKRNTSEEFDKSNNWLVHVVDGARTGIKLEKLQLLIKKYHSFKNQPINETDLKNYLNKILSHISAYFKHVRMFKRTEVGRDIIIDYNLSDNPEELPMSEQSYLNLILFYFRNSNDYSTFCIERGYSLLLYYRNSKETYQNNSEIIKLADHFANLAMNHKHKLPKGISDVDVACHILEIYSKFDIEQTKKESIAKIAEVAIKPLTSGNKRYAEYLILLFRFFPKEYGGKYLGDKGVLQKYLKKARHVKDKESNAVGNAKLEAKEASSDSSKVIIETSTQPETQALELQGSWRSGTSSIVSKEDNQLGNKLANQALPQTRAINVKLYSLEELLSLVANFNNSRKPANKNELLISIGRYLENVHIGKAINISCDVSIIDNNLKEGTRREFAMYHKGYFNIISFYLNHSKKHDINFIKNAYGIFGFFGTVEARYLDKSNILKLGDFFYEILINNKLDSRYAISDEKAACYLLNIYSKYVDQDNNRVEHVAAIAKIAIGRLNKTGESEYATYLLNLFNSFPMEYRNEDYPDTNVLSEAIKIAEDYKLKNIEEVAVVTSEVKTIAPQDSAVVSEVKTVAPQDSAVVREVKAVVPQDSVAIPEVKAVITQDSAVVSKIIAPVPVNLTRVWSAKKDWSTLKPAPKQVVLNQSQTEIGSYARNLKVLLKPNSKLSLDDIIKAINLYSKINARDIAENELIKIKNDLIKVSESYITNVSIRREVSTNEIEIQDSNLKNDNTNAKSQPNKYLDVILFILENTNTPKDRVVRSFCNYIYVFANKNYVIEKHELVNIERLVFLAKSLLNSNLIEEKNKGVLAAYVIHILNKYYFKKFEQLWIIDLVVITSDSIEKFSLNDKEKKLAKNLRWALHDLRAEYGLEVELKEYYDLLDGFILSKNPYHNFTKFTKEENTDVSSTKTKPQIQQNTLESLEVDTANSKPQLQQESSEPDLSAQLNLAGIIKAIKSFNELPKDFDAQKTVAIKLQLVATCKSYLANITLIKESSGSTTHYSFKDGNIKTGNAVTKLRNNEYLDLLLFVFENSLGTNTKTNSWLFYHLSSFCNQKDAFNQNDLPNINRLISVMYSVLTNNELGKENTNRLAINMIRILIKVNFKEFNKKLILEIIRKAYGSLDAYSQDDLRENIRIQLDRLVEELSKKYELGDESRQYQKNFLGEESLAIVINVPLEILQKEIDSFEIGISDYFDKEKVFRKILGSYYGLHIADKEKIKDKISHLYDEVLKAGRNLFERNILTKSNKAWGVKLTFLEELKLVKLFINQGKNFKSGNQYIKPVFDKELYIKNIRRALDILENRIKPEDSNFASWAKIIYDSVVTSASKSFVIDVVLDSFSRFICDSKEISQYYLQLKQVKVNWVVKNIENFLPKAEVKSYVKKAEALSVLGFLHKEGCKFNDYIRNKTFEFVAYYATKQPSAGNLSNVEYLVKIAYDKMPGLENSQKYSAAFNLLNICSRNIFKEPETGCFSKLFSIVLDNKDKYDVQEIQRLFNKPYSSILNGKLNKDVISQLKEIGVDTSSVVPAKIDWIDLFHEANRSNKARDGNLLTIY